jgi:hypothetical protein
MASKKAMNKKADYHDRGVKSWETRRENARKADYRARGLKAAATRKKNLGT